MSLAVMDWWVSTSVTDLQGLAIVDLGVPSVGKIGIDHEIVDDQIRDISDLDAAWLADVRDAEVGVREVDQGLCVVVDIVGQHLNSLHAVVDLLSHKQSLLWCVENRAICVLVILEVFADLLHELEYGAR